MPGWIVIVASVVHSDEALLAAGFIFTFHFFSVYFRVETFPVDPVIFSGRLTGAKMLHERKRRYEPLVATGRLGEIRLRDEWTHWQLVMPPPVGFLAFGIGTVLPATCRRQRLDTLATDGGCDGEWLHEFAPEELERLRVCLSPLSATRCNHSGPTRETVLPAVPR